MKRILHILIAINLALVGCTQKELDNPQKDDIQSSTDTTGRVLVRFDVSLPELSPLTKALGDTPAGDLTSMHLAIFGRSGYLKEYVEASIEPATANGKVGETTNRYTISAILELSENSERHIHFIGNGPETLEYGQETDLIPNLLSPTGVGGYWQYAIVPGIKAKRNRDKYGEDYCITNELDPDAFVIDGGYYVLHDDTAAYFADIPLIRNFSKIVVEDIPGCNFQTISFAVVNVATEGSIAPYYSDGFITNYQLQGYDDLRDRLHYPALLPLQVNFNSSVPSASAFTSNPVGTGVAAYGGSVFMYERPIPDDDQKPTSVIIYGTFTDPDKTDGDDESGNYYYKVDLMDDDGYYPIYRNFKYRIQIKEILRPGANSPEDALRTMGSGDISADIATQNLTDISDGTSHILVSYMSKTLIHQYPYVDGNTTEQLTLLYKYIPEVSADTNNDGQADWNNALVADGGPVSITLQAVADSVITSYSVASGDDANGFRTITITTSAPSGYLRSQYLQIKGTRTVTDPETNKTKTTTLYRNVTFSMISTQTMTVTCTPTRLPKNAGEDMRIDITIPKDLPPSMFPLVFNVEADSLSLTPDNSKANNNLPVKTGTSLSGNGKPSFYFIRTVTEDEYQRLTAASATTTVSIPCYFITNKAENASNIYVIDEGGFFLPGRTSFKNFGAKYFEDLNFPIGVPKTTGGSAPFTFRMDNTDELPDKVYMKFENVRPTASSGLSIITDTSDPHHGWYWYSPTQTHNQDLRNQYLPTVSLATTNTTGIADVWIEADEYATAHLHYTVPATGITLSPNTQQTLTLNSANPNDATVDITATVTPSNSTDVVTWTSANTGIATVDANGHVTAVGSGTTTITATAGSVSASVSIRVRTLSFSNQSFVLPTDNNGWNTITELPLGLRDVYFRFDYVSGYKYPVTFTLTGLTTQDDRLVDNGNGTFTYTPRVGDDNLTQYVHLKSTLRFTGVSAQISNEYYEAVSDDSKSLSRPTSFKLTAGSSLAAGTRRPRNNTTYANAYYIATYENAYFVSGSDSYNNRTYRTRFTDNNEFTSRDDVTINLTKYGDSVESGVVYFRYDGEDSDRVSGYHYASVSLATLCDTYIVNGQRVTLDFRIAVTGVSLNKTNATVPVGNTLQLTATVSPSNADITNVTWSSSNTAVATVSSTGLVTGVARGTATITATTVDGGYTATCEVKVLRRANVINMTNYYFPVTWPSDYSSLGEVTYETWIYTTNKTGDSHGNQSIIGIEGSFLLRIEDQQFQVIGRRANGNELKITYSDLDYMGEWTHIAAVFSKSARTITLYINGEQMAKSGNNALGSYNLQMNGESGRGGSWNNPYSFLIGNACDGYRRINGNIAYTRVWKTARTQSEIQSNMYTETLSSSDMANLIGYWKFTEGSGNVITNYSTLTGSSLNLGKPIMNSYSPDASYTSDIVWEDGSLPF